MDRLPDGGWVVDRARRWLDAHAGEDAFLYLHLMDPHEPYRDHSGGGAEAPPLRPLSRRERVPGPGEVELLRDLYAGEVRHTDRVLEPFLAELPPGAAVVFTADHGEALGEHGAWAHGLNLYREALDVPLMIRAPGVAPGVAAAPAQLLDLGPTVLDLAGVDPDPGMAGRSLLAGGSSAALVSVTFSAGPLRWSWRDGNRKVVLRTAVQPELGATARRQSHESRPLATGAVVFDLATDPGENRPAVVPAELVPDVRAAFAAGVGRLVPGLQLLVAGGDGPVEMALGIDGEPEVVQAWSTGPVDVAWTTGEVAIRCANASPLCAVAIAGDSVPARVTPLPGDVQWRGVIVGEPADPRQLTPPEQPGPGASLWWNPDRPLVVGGYDETVERLRALGYID
jgi:hypothetical protein